MLWESMVSMSLKGTHTLHCIHAKCVPLTHTFRFTVCVTLKGHGLELYITSYTLLYLWDFFNFHSFSLSHLLTAFLVTYIRKAFRPCLDQFWQTLYLSDLLDNNETKDWRHEHETMRVLRQMFAPGSRNVWLYLSHLHKCTVTNSNNAVQTV